MRTNIAVYFTEPDGRTMLFAAGEYEDVVVVEDDTARFREKTVVLDTDLLPRYFVYPL
jgi:3-phenylpropionate/cinnamic acid dioxygenase small subunit